MEKDTMSLLSLIPSEFVLTGLEASDKSEAIHALATLFINKGYVKDSFVDAVLLREEKFPTGLRTLDVHVAIPHCDIEHCIKPGIAVSVLSSPVRFTEMATNDQFVDVEIIFLLAITEPDQQVVWLARLVTLFQTKGFLTMLYNSKNPVEGHKIIIGALQKEAEKETEINIRAL